MHAVTILATAVPSAPAYVGTFELTVTAVAAAFGVPAADALAWALVAHAVTLLPLPEEFAFPPDGYLEQLRRIKAAVRIPVLGSLNGTSPQGWLDYAWQIQQAGADALELNFYHVATDPTESGADLERRLLEVVRMVKARVGIPVAIKLSSARIRFQVGPAVLRSRLIDGTFPDYERVIPSGNDKLMVAQVKELSEAIDRVATISTDRSRAIKLALAEGRLTLSAVSPEAGRAVEELDVGYRSEPLEIGFNARYMLDMSAQVEGDEIEVAIADAGSPMVVRDPKDSSTLYVLMPMRV